MDRSVIHRVDLREASDPLGAFVERWPELAEALRQDFREGPWLHALQLCSMEAVTNAVRYGSPDTNAPPEIRIEIEWSRGEWIELRVFDRGPGMADFASHTAFPENVLAESGRGIPIMHHLMDEARYQVDSPENCLVLRIAPLDRETEDAR